MTTTFVSGRDLSLTIDGKEYDAQASSCLLTREINRERYEVLSGPVYRTNTTEGTLQVTMMLDYGAVDSLCEALDDAATLAPDTALDFSMVVNGETFAGKVFPTHPDAGGEAPDVIDVTVEMTLDAGTEVTRTGAA